MRDGVYKDLPLPKPYKDLVRASEREAEHGEVTQRLALRAIAHDVRRELPSGFVTRLLQMADEVEIGLFGLSALAASGNSRDLGGRNSALANDVLAHARRLIRDGYSGRRLAERALAEGIRDWRDRRIRQIEEHCISRDARSTAGASADALRVANLQDVATRLLEKRPSENVQPVRAPLDIDEDLPLP